MYRTYHLLFIFQAFSLIGMYGQTHTISGYIEEGGSGEKMPGAHIVDRHSGRGTVSNDFGFFSLSLTQDSVLLVVSFVGYESKQLGFFLNGNREVNFQLDPAVELETVEVSAGRTEPIEEISQMSTIEVPMQQLKHTPTFLGESDVLKVLQLLPGVQSGSEGQSGLFVRGGSPDQNLILLDGVPVYNASHLFGFVSVFNTDAVQEVTLIKGGFPARYAGRISAIVDIRLKEGHLKKWRGTGSIGLVSAKLAVEGPLKKDTSSLFFSARRSYIDILARPLIKKAFTQKNGNLGYYFYDLNFKVNHRFSRKDRIFWSFYSGKDEYSRIDEFRADRTLTKVDVGLSWANTTSAFRWNHLWGPKLFSNATLTYSKFRYRTKNNSESEPTTSSDSSRVAAHLDYAADIEDLAARLDFDLVPSPRHFFRFGGSLIFHRFNPGTFNVLFSQDNQVRIDTIHRQDRIEAVETGWYIEDDWEITDWWRVNAGLHLSGYKVGHTFYQAWQPRLSMRFLLPGRLGLKASYSKMAQYVQLLTNEGVGLPTDLWLPTTERVLPQSGWQAGAGLARSFRNVEVSLEGYYRRMANALNYKAGASLLEASDWQDKVIQGDGKAYGLEVLVQKKTGRLTGWLGYTLSWSFRRFDDLNQGKLYFFRYDRRHDLSLVSSYKLSEKIRISCNWVFSSGSPITVFTNSHAVRIPTASIEGYQIHTGTVFVPGRNNFRLGNYHRFDIGVEYSWKKGKLQHNLTIGAYNAYNRKNPFYILRFAESYRRADGETGQEIKLKQFGLFPIIPALNYRLNWSK